MTNHAKYEWKILFLYSINTPHEMLQTTSLIFIMVITSLEHSLGHTLRLHLNLMIFWSQFYLTNHTSTNQLIHQIINPSKAPILTNSSFNCRWSTLRLKYDVRFFTHHPYPGIIQSTQNFIWLIRKWILSNLHSPKISFALTSYDYPSKTCFHQTIIFLICQTPIPNFCLLVFQLITSTKLTQKVIIVTFNSSLLRLNFPSQRHHQWNISKEQRCLPHLFPVETPTFPHPS